MTAPAPQAAAPAPSPTLCAAIRALQAGGMVVMVDDEQRENEGDLVMAAELVTPAAVNFMATHGRGLICLPLDPAQVDRLGLPLQPRRGHDPRGTAFTVSIEATHGVTTGICATDRARTIRLAAEPATDPAEISTPGHIFPLRAHPDGVLGRDGHTEGSTDLARLAGLQPAAVICEIMNPDGTMARLRELRSFAARHGLPVISVAEIAAWCRAHGRGALALPQEPPAAPLLLERVAEAALPSAHGGEGGEELRVHAFRDAAGQEHVALVKGDPAHGVPLVRLHSECLTGDALGSLRCDCGEQLREALRCIGEADSGVLVYLRGQEGRGIGLANKIRAYALQDRGYDTLDANIALGLPVDARDWSVAGAILAALGITTLDLLTNNPGKTDGLKEAGLTVRRQHRLQVPSNPFNRAYLHTKRTRMGHQLSDILPETVPAAIADFIRKTETT